MATVIVEGISESRATPTFADSVPILMLNGLVQRRIPDQGLKKAAKFVPYLQQTLEKPPLEAARAAFVVA